LWLFGAYAPRFRLCYAKKDVVNPWCKIVWENQVCTRCPYMTSPILNRPAHDIPKMAASRGQPQSSAKHIMLNKMLMGKAA